MQSAHEKLSTIRATVLMVSHGLDGLRACRSHCLDRSRHTQKVGVPQDVIAAYRRRWFNGIYSHRNPGSRPDRQSSWRSAWIFMETFRQSEFEEYCGSAQFVQDNHSGSGQGICGAYIINLNTQGKLIRVVVGEVFDVAVDIRQVLRPWQVGRRVSFGRKQDQLWVPEGFAHAYYVISEWAEFVYKPPTITRLNGNVVCFGMTQRLVSNGRWSTESYKTFQQGCQSANAKRSRHFPFWLD